MLKKILAGVSVSVLAATLAYAQGAGAPAGAPGGARNGAQAGAQGGRGGGTPRLPTKEEWDNMPAAGKAYVEKARALAGNDADLKFDFGVFCQASGGSGNEDRATIGVPVGAPYPAYPSPSPAVRLPAQHMFDNFWWLGDTGVGSWLITTSAGYILFDSSNNAGEAQEVIIDAMKKVNLDPAKIKYLIFGHFHLDHTGGGHLIQSLYHPRVIMGRDDWDLYFKSMEQANEPNASGLAGRMDDKVAMKRDIDAEDGMKITLGDTTITIVTMTGHTPGSLGMVVPIKWKGVKHNILVVTAATDVHNRESFIGGYEHIWDIGEANKVEAVYQVHPNTNMNLLARVKYVNDNFDKLKANNNPLLYGVDKTHRYIEIMRACTQARMVALGW